MNFTNVLLHVCRIEILLPLLDQSDDKSLGFEENCRRIESVCNLLRSALLIDEEQQRYLVEIHGMSIVSRFLVKYHPKSLSYGLYRHFLDLSNQVSVPALKNQIVESVLVNFEIWSHSAFFVCITEDWRIVLFVFFPEIIKELLTLPKLLDCMRIYLWYTVREHFSRDRNLTVDEIAAVRQELLMLIATHYITTEAAMPDMVLLMSHAVSLRDPRQVVDLLQIFKEKMPLLGDFLKTTEAFTGLSLLLHSDDEDVFLAALSLVGDIHHENLVPDLSIHGHLDIIFHQLKTRPLPPSLLLKMAELSQLEFPEIFEMCSFFAITSGKGVFLKFFGAISPSEAFCSRDIWCIWSVFGAVVYQADIVFDFLIQCSPSSWRYIFIFIDRVCQVLEKDAGPWQALFLRRLSALVFNGTCPASLDYFKVAWFFIMFRKSRPHSLPILVGCNQHESRPIRPAPPLESTTKWTAFVDNHPALKGNIHPDCTIESLVLDSPIGDLESWMFGLRFDSDFKWLDYDLAIQVLQLYPYSPDESFAWFFVVLASFAARYDPKIGPSIVNEIIQGPFRANPGLVKLIHHPGKSTIDLESFCA
jgi:hypothetical protein